MSKSVAALTLLFALTASALPGTAQVLVPAAGSVAGANGTFFRSDLSVWNLRDVPQPVRLQWIPQAGAPAAAPIVLTVPARSALRSEDFVRDVLMLSGLGAVLVQGVTLEGGVDAAARLQVTCRIWTPQPASTGTTSQSLPSVAGDVNNPGTNATVFGLRRDERYRVNVGVVNLDPSHAQTFEVEVPQSRLSFPPEVYTVEVPASSMQLIALNTALPQPLSDVRVFNRTAEATRSSRWLAYGSSIDNVTGDAWSELAVPDVP